MGEHKIRGEAMHVRTPGGVVEVRWDERGTATAMGQLAFFAEYLEATGLFEGWLRSCPLRYSSPNAPALVDVLGTWMLSILDGHCRYAHVGALRGDGVATHILGMNKVIGDDSLRRALGAIAPEPLSRHTDPQRQAQQAQVARSVQWMQQHLRRSVDAALYTPWILDCDTTIKVLYGRQQAGAVVSYNPHKPGRPSHAIHTYWIGNLRMVLDAALESGDRHAPKHGRPGLVALLEGLPPEQRPQLVRGDCAFGNEGDMNALEELGQPYLFKLRQSVGVKKLIKQQWQRDDWSPVGQGWQACEDELRLMGWSRKRRVVVMRRQRPMDCPDDRAQVKRGRPRKENPPEQAELHFIDENQPVKSWEYAVLVCNTDYEVEHIGQLYRDRADCRVCKVSGFDEIKNQWGWGGYTTHDIERCALSARAVALIYNWWSWYVRLAHPKTRLEAITSRPMLLAAVGRMTRHSRVTKLVLAVTHEAAAQIKVLIANVRAGLDQIRAAAPQLDKAQRWPAMLRYIVGQMLACKGPRGAPPATVPTG